MLRNLIDCKETMLPEANRIRSLIYIEYINVARHLLFGHVIRKEKLEFLVTTGVIEGTLTRVKQPRKDGWTNKMTKCTKSDEG